MTGETLQRTDDDRFRCEYCGGVSPTRLPNHEADCPVIRDDVPEYFEDLDFGTELRYIGPDEVADGFVTPKERAQPYTLKYVSAHGTVAFEDQYNRPKYLGTSHPCRDPRYWAVVDA